MKYHRFTLAFAAVFPLVGFTYACSSSDAQPGKVVEPDPSPDGSDVDSNVDEGGDSGDAIDTGDTDFDTGNQNENFVKCVGNPLTATDETAPDGGKVIDFAEVPQIVDEPASIPETLAVLGPRYVEISVEEGLKGQLIYSTFAPGRPAELISINPDGTERKSLRTATGDGIFAGSAIENDTILTVEVISSSTPTTGFIVQTKTDGTRLSEQISTDPSTDPYGLVVGPTGDLYFTDGQIQDHAAGVSGVYRISPPPTRVVTRISEANNPDPKGIGQLTGIALSADAKTLYTAIWDQKQIVSWTVNADGSVGSDYAPFVTTADGPDGIAIDTGGNLWVAENALDYSLNGRVEVFAPDGTKYGEIEFPTQTQQAPMGITFGGADNQTLFITTKPGGVYTYNVRCAGIR